MPPKPSEKRTRVSRWEEENLCHVDASDAILKDIQNKLEKLNESTDRIEERLVRIETYMTSMKGKVADLEKGLNSVNTEVAEIKQDIEKKADFEKLQMLESVVEELRNRSRRNNLVFYNVPEKAEGQNCAEFIQNFIVRHMGLEMEQAEIERAHRTPTHPLNNSMKQPRPIHVAFLRYTDKVKILSSAAARLRNNPFRGNVIGIGPDYAKNTQHWRKALVPYKKHLQKKLGQDRKEFIAYPATLKYMDENGNPKVVSDEDFKKMKGEMAKDS